MKRVKYLICTAILFMATSCADFEQSDKEIINLEEIKNTVWQNEDILNKVYYNIEYSDVESGDVEGWYNGEMTGYDSTERVNKIDTLTRNFIYNFTPATDFSRAIVRTKFNDGINYDGYVVPKGNIQMGEKEVFVIQLFEVDDKGEILLDNGKYKSTLLMWKE
ncbi:MAG: hypothetical protein J6V55_00145 [Alistipes sp.]|nr:hypothetical protein [Alistipes sp.]